MCSRYVEGLLPSETQKRISLAGAKHLLYQHELKGHSEKKATSAKTPYTNTTVQCHLHMGTKRSSSGKFEDDE